MEKPVLFETKEGIAIITLNRPEKRNAINREFLIHLYNYLDEVSSNDKIRTAIIARTGKCTSPARDINLFSKKKRFSITLGFTDGLLTQLIQSVPMQ